MEVSYLPDAHLHPLWSGIERILAPASDGDVFDPAIDVVWIAYEGPTLWGACTTRLRTDGVARLRLMGGRRFKEWMGELDRIVTAWARDCGAPMIVMTGRKGWSRFADTYGWTVTGTDDGKINFEKQLG